MITEFMSISPKVYPNSPTHGGQQPTQKGQARREVSGGSLDWRRKDNTEGWTQGVEELMAMEWSSTKTISATDAIKSSFVNRNHGMIREVEVLYESPNVEAFRLKGMREGR